MTRETQTFQAEIKELLNLMIHSLYSHKEIFLRELVSNASDAIDKLKFQSLTDTTLHSDKTEFQIVLKADKDTHSLSIIDNGIGMNRAEISEFLGTIAKSGTKKFAALANADLKSRPELIGQFGVGFYSAFMVAKKVIVLTQKAGTTSATRFESDGLGSYTLEDAERTEGNGTTIQLFLKKKEELETDTDEASQETSAFQDFTDEYVLKSLIKKYSDFITYPIKLADETLNSMQALWLKPSNEVKPEEYNEFYKHLSHDWVDPLKTIHFKAEGVLEYASLLYIPAKRPFDFYHSKKQYGLSLYVKRVFIMDDCEELIPPYLRFMKGVVDSSDLSLNVSREILQKDQQVTRMKKGLVNKILNTLKDLQSNDRKTYETFYTEFGATLKEGIATDHQQKTAIENLLLYPSTASDEVTTLKDYVSRMKIDQKGIYYITGESRSVIENSPYLEQLRVKGFEVLFMTDPVDEWVVQSLNEFEGKKLISIVAEKLDLDTEEEKKKKESERKEEETRLGGLLGEIRTYLSEKVKDVKLSDRLSESPVCLVSSNDGMTPQMERLMESMGQAAPKASRILEINAKHPLFEKMKKAPEGVKREWSEILFEQALLNEGAKIANPQALMKKITSLMIDASVRFDS